jgi:hypothetical protein
MREKEKRTMASPKYELNKIGRPVAKGKCEKCGCNMTLALGADNTPADLKAKAEAWKKTHAGQKRPSRKSKKGGKSRKSRKSRKSSK